MANSQVAPKKWHRTFKDAFLRRERTPTSRELTAGSLLLLSKPLSDSLDRSQSDQGEPFQRLNNIALGWLADPTKGTVCREFPTAAEQDAMDKLFTNSSYESAQLLAEAILERATGPHSAIQNKAATLLAGALSDSEIPRDEERNRELMLDLAINMLRLVLDRRTDGGSSGTTETETLRLALSQRAEEQSLSPFDPVQIQNALELCLDAPASKSAFGATSLSNMGNACFALYHKTKLPRWMDEAIASTGRAIRMQEELSLFSAAEQATPKSRFIAHRAMSMELMFKYSSPEGRAYDLDDAVRHGKIAVEFAIQARESVILIRQAYEALQLAISLQYKNSSNFAARIDMISATTALLQLTPEAHVAYKHRLVEVLKVMSSFYGFRELESPNLTAIIAGDVKKPQKKNNLANNLFEAVQMTIYSALDKLNSAEDVLDIQAIFAHKSDKYFSEYKAKSAFLALLLAIELGNLSVLLSSPESKARNKILLSQAEKMMEHAQCTSNVHDMLSSLHYAEVAIIDMDDDSEIWYHNAFRLYGRLLYCAYEQTHATGFLDDAIQIIHSRILVGKPDKENPDISAPDNISWMMAIQTLAKCYEARYQRRGDVKDLRTAALIAGNAGQLAQRDGLLQAERENEIGISLIWTIGQIMLTKFKATGSVLTLKNSITNLETCLKLTSIDHMEWPLRSESLSHAYRELMKIENKDFNQAQAIVRLEVPYMELKAEGNEYSSNSKGFGLQHLVNSNLAFPPRFVSGDKLKQEGIFMEMRKMKFACYARITNHLADLLAESAMSLKNEMLSKASQPKNSELTQAEIDAMRAFVDKEIGQAYCNKGKEVSYMSDQDMTSESDSKTVDLWHRNAIKYFREVAGSYECSGLERIRAAYRAMQMLVADKDHASANQLAKDATDQIVRLNLVNLTFKDQEYLMQQLSGFSSLTASLALFHNEDAGKIMVSLESSRARITGVAMELRKDPILLHENNPETIAEYNRLRKALLPRGGTTHVRVVAFERNGKLLGHRMSQAVGDFKNALKLRSMMQDLQLSTRSRGEEMTKERLVAAAGQGPLVSFTSTSLGSHAIVVTNTDVNAIPLPKLLKQDVEDNLRLLTGESAVFKGLASSEWERNLRLGNVLEWLWDSAVFPVLEALGYVRQPENSQEPITLPRIWWVNGGPMSAFPLHAAGKYGPGSTDYAMSHVISSYTSSIRLLEHLQTVASKSRVEADLAAVIVSMSKTHGMAPLPFATQEAGYVKEALELSANISPIVMDKPSKEEVVKQVGSAHLLHLICHGKASQTSPSEGYLLLDNEKHDDSGKLTVEEFGCVMDQGTEFAYLSACSSAEHSNLDLVDEVIHLANGLQMTGVPRVVATLWPVDDEASASIAQQFYKSLNLKNSTNWDTAKALHEAVRAYMSLDDGISSNEECFLSWVPLVHYGL